MMCFRIRKMNVLFHRTESQLVEVPCGIRGCFRKRKLYADHETTADEQIRRVTDKGIKANSDGSYNIPDEEYQISVSTGSGTHESSGWRSE